MHSAVWATGGIPSDKPVIGRGVVTAALGLAGLMMITILPAQSAGDAGPPDSSEPVSRAQQWMDAGGGIPEEPELPAADPPDIPAEARNRLEAARIAMDEGRVDLPEDNSAWFFYRWVADRYPGNEEARNGLLAVQQDMLVRAIQHAVDMDFDAAELLLEIASSVIDEQNQQEQARAVIGSIKASRASMLESQAMELMDIGEFDAAERVLIDLIALGGQEETVRKLRRELEEARNYGGFRVGQIFRDKFVYAEIITPELVVVPTGSYLKGSSDREKGRAENEGPQQRVTFQRGFAMGRHEVSVAEFRVFIEASDYRTEAERHGRSTVYDAYSGRLTEKENVDWHMDYEGSPAEPEAPVIHVSWNDAQAYVSWLANGTGKPYRLPSEAEFEYGLRAGSNSRYWWGNASPSRVVENITGERDSSHSRRFWAEAFSGYGDKFWGPAPVASFEPNPFGLYDMGGNVSEWVRDCWHDTYVRGPVDGSAWINPGCPQRVIRGGHWASLPIQTRSAYRRYAAPGYHDARVGFRIARDL